MIVQRTRLARSATPSPHVGESVADTSSTLVYVLGIGFMIYVGLEFVLPALFGATAKTKNAYRAMRTPGGSGERPEFTGSGRYRGEYPSTSWMAS